MDENSGDPDQLASLEACADPESFVRGGSILTFFYFFLFLVDEGW